VRATIAGAEIKPVEPSLDHASEGRKVMKKPVRLFAAILVPALMAIAARLLANRCRPR
jgi:hypothetical protein